MAFDELENQNNSSGNGESYFPGNEADLEALLRSAESLLNDTPHQLNAAPAFPTPEETQAPASEPEKKTELGESDPAESSSASPELMKELADLMKSSASPADAVNALIPEDNTGERKPLYTVRHVSSEEDGSVKELKRNDGTNVSRREKSSQRQGSSHPVKKVKKPRKKLNVRLRRNLYVLFFPLAIFYMELINAFHSSEGIAGWSLIYIFLFSFGFGFACLFIVSLLNRRPAYIVSIILTSILFLIFSIQTVYFTIFKTFTVLAMAGMAADAITGFFGATVSGIFRSTLWLLLLAVPLFLVVRFGERVLPKKHNKPVAILFLLAAAFVTTFIGTSLVRANNAGIMSYRYVYDDTFEVNLSVPRFGILTTLRQEVRNNIWAKTGYTPPKPEDSVSLDATETTGVVQKGNTDGLQPADNPVSVPNSGGLPLITKHSGGQTEGEIGEAGMTGSGDPSGTGETSPTTGVPSTGGYKNTDTSPNVTFTRIVTNSGNSTIESITDFVNSQPATNKNQYTGMFKGYNLIYICAEGFSRYAVDETHTPTLWKLSHEGFVFNNFYNPIWTHSTSDGEFAMLTGLIPFSGTTPFELTIEDGNNNMYLSPGNMFKRLGYLTKAYHGHRGKYYDRNLTHPNLGYDFVAPGFGMYFPGSSTKYPYAYFESSGATDGLIIDDTWPESDVQVVDVSTPQYVNNEPFHVYYMTISGHGNYSYSGNNMSKKHWDEVQDMNVDDTAKAYVACHMELDQSMKLLIERLQAAGSLDKTVIVLCGDHYPYLITGNGASVSDEGLATLSSLAGEPIEKKFELYRSTLIIWNNKMGTIPVDKYCYSVDVLPTVYNLFGIDYDSRLLMGTDILSDSDALVIFNDRSYITDKGRYNASTDTFTPNEGVSVSQTYAAEVFTIVKNKSDFSKKIIVNDYYNYVFQ